jgi:phosphoglycerol transferase
MPPYQELKADFNSDATFVRKIEATVPSHTMIFQLPYIPFPESPPVNRMVDYDHLRGYLHSKDLCWSYGAMKGSKVDRWQRDTAGKPTEEMLSKLRAAGFGGIYIDRFGYADGGVRLESELARALNATPLVSPNQRLLFFSLAPEAKLHALHEGQYQPALQDSAKKIDHRRAM